MRGVRAAITVGCEALGLLALLLVLFAWLAAGYAFLGGVA